MKTRSFLFVLALMVFAAVSCTTESTTKKTEVTLDTRGVQAEEDAPASFVTGTWKNGDTWVNLKIDGTFEGSFDGGDVIVGKWNLSDDEKVLKLAEEKGTEGKGQSFAQSYNVLELSDAVMRVEDTEGNILDLKAE
jgi:hypothetical protein